jgi:ElaB/YqjD/DUF883 family membrane-anchored ribosome-binding protein
VEQTRQQHVLSQYILRGGNMTRSIAEIRRESELNRQELAATVSALRSKISDAADDIKQKVSPENLKEEVSGYVAGKGRHWLDGLKQQAMDNPMQTAGTAMAMAIPALRLVRAIPFPLMMIGAGLAMTSKRVRGAVAEHMPFDVDAATGQASDIAGAVSDAANEVAGTARQRFDAARDNIRRTAHDARDAVAGTYDNVQKAAAYMRDAAVSTYGDAKASVSTGQVSQIASSVADDATSRLKAGLDTATSGARDAFQTSRGAVAQAAVSVKHTTEATVRNNAMLVGGLGLAIGAIIAAALPSTEAEKSTLKGASGQVRRFASSAVETGFENAREAVLSAVDDVSRKVGEANVGSLVGETADRLGEKLKTVADNAITTAFEPDHSNQRS